MLQSIRERAQGWIAWAIVILITIPFALWGIQEYLGVGAEPVVATVNGDEITERELDQAYQKFRRELRERFGGRLPGDLFDEERLRDEVLDNMIRNRLIQQTSTELGLYAGNAQVRNAILAIPAFQKDGQFDPASYERALQFQGFAKPAQFEDRLRRSLVTAQLEFAVQGTDFVTPRELQEAVRLERQRRDLSYLVVPANEFLSTEALADSEVEEFYSANQQRFSTPERVRLEYLLLDLETLGSMLEPQEENLIALYESAPTQFVGSQQREASHILVTLDEAADAATEEAARAKIEAALQRIRNGEDFAEVAREVSEDPGSSAAGGQLGFFSPGDMDPAFEEAAYDAEVGQVTEPVRTPFGFHLILVTAVEGEGKTSFEEAREDVLKAYRRKEAEQLLFDYAERLSDLAYEHPDSLVPAAEALGLKVQISDWMTRQGGEGPLAAPKVVSAAFSDDVLAQGNNSELIELGTERMLVLRVRDHEEAGVKPLADVRDEAIEQFRAEQARKLAMESAKSLLQRLEAGEDLAAIVQETGYELKQPGAVGRSSDELPAGLAQPLFRMRKPQGDAPTYSLAELASGDVAVIALHRVNDGSVEELEPADADRLNAEMRRARGRDYYQHLVEYLRSVADVTVTAK